MLFRSASTDAKLSSFGPGSDSVSAVPELDKVLRTDSNDLAILLVQFLNDEDLLGGQDRRDVPQSAKSRHRRPGVRGQGVQPGATDENRSRQCAEKSLSDDAGQSPSG